MSDDPVSTGTGTECGPRIPTNSKSRLAVGIGSRNYSYRRVAYGLPVGNARYAKGVYVPWRFLSRDPRWENTYAFMPCERFDLYHLWNGILLNRRPFVTSFEAHLPRVFTRARGAWYRMALKRLKSPDCRRLLALSEFAKRMFLFQNEGEVDDALARKVEVFHGGVEIPGNALEKRLEALARMQTGPLRCCLVGHDFFRKGGFPVVRAFERMARTHADVKLIVVSRLNALDYASHESLERAAEVRRVLQAAPWAEWHEQLPHSAALELMATCHVGLLPTLDDTFGWSAVEAMSNGLPMISTNVCALPEIVVDGSNGYTIKLDLVDAGLWAGLSFAAGSSEAKAARDSAYDSIEHGLVSLITNLVQARGVLEPMSRNAIAHVGRQHDPAAQGHRLSVIYEQCVGG